MSNSQPESTPSISQFLNLILIVVLFVSVFGNVIVYSDLQFEQSMNRILTVRADLAESRAELYSVIYDEMLIAERWENSIRSFYECGFSDFMPIHLDGKTYCFRGNWKVSRLAAISRASDHFDIDYITTPPTYDEPGYQAVWIEDVGDLSDFWDYTGIFR